MTLRSKFVRLFLTVALLLPQLQLAGFASTRTISRETWYEIGRILVPDTITGTLKGYVYDPGGLGIPGVSVRVTNLETGNSRTKQTDDKGLYQFALLPMGPYRIEASKDGFIMAALEKPSITVKLNQTVEWAPPIRMSPAALAPVMAAAQTPQPTPTPQPSTMAATMAKEEYGGKL
ncbi:MAG: carboxypeptidase-like regulatory domain-containing protein, partial [Acidobacteriota bacterium]